MIKSFRAFLNQNPNLKRLYRNAAIIFSGNIVSAFFSFIALTLTARALGIEAFGTFALVTAFIALMDRFSSFQSWQAIIHYGAHHKDLSALSQLFAFGFMLDLAGSFLGGIITLVLGYFVPQWFGITESQYSLVVIASMVLFFNWVSTPTAIMRKYNKFFIQAIYQKLTGGLNLLGVGILWLCGEGQILHYVIVWAVSQVIAKIYFIYKSYQELKNQGTFTFELNLPKVKSQNPGLWKFVWTTNLDGVVRVGRDTDIFIVNLILGPSAVALYKISREITKVATKLTGPFYQAIYPDLSHLSAEKSYKEFTRLMKQSSLTLGGIVLLGWVIFMISGKWLILTFLGAQFLDSFPVALWTMGATVVWALSQPLAPAMIALGRPGDTFLIHLLTTLLYCILVYFLTSVIGIEGAGIALFIFYVIWSLMMLIKLKSNLQKKV
jgi:O-antigen/teichoic acid export membrane protein